LIKDSKKIFCLVSEAARSEKIVAVGPGSLKVQPLINFLSVHDFDGVDLDWEYPEADDRSGKPEDYKNIFRFSAAIVGFGILPVQINAVKVMNRQEIDQRFEACLFMTLTALIWTGSIPKPTIAAENLKIIKTSRPKIRRKFSAWFQRQQGRRKS
jgi:hypothetical protein